MLEPSFFIITTDIKRQLFTLINEPSRRSLLQILHLVTTQRKLSDTVFRMTDLWYALSQLLSICLFHPGASCFAELVCLDQRFAGASQNTFEYLLTTLLVTAPYMPSVPLHSCLGELSRRSYIHIVVATKKTYANPLIQPFFGAMGCTSAIVFTCFGAAYGTAKSGVGISAMGVLRPDLIVKSTSSLSLRTSRTCQG